MKAFKKRVKTSCELKNNLIKIRHLHNLQVFDEIPKLALNIRMRNIQVLSDEKKLRKKLIKTQSTL